MQVIQTAWNEDGSATALGRVTGGTNATGAATGVAGEGKWLKQADLNSAVRNVFDLSGDTPDTPILTTTLTISSVINDTPQTATTYWTVDTVGYNFIDDIPATAFPIGGHRYRVEYKFTSPGSIVGWGFFEGIAVPNYTS